MIPWPTQNITFVRWADAFRQTRPDLAMMRVQSEDDWKMFGERLLQDNAASTASCPHPSGFPNWTEWAEGLIKAFGISG